MSNRLLNASALAVLTVVAIYFATVAFGRFEGSWRVFLPLDILVYLAIGFFSARSLQSWRVGFVVVAAAALTDIALAVASLILPGAPQMSPMQIARAEAFEGGLNALVGLLGAIIATRRM